MFADSPLVIDSRLDADSLDNSRSFHDVLSSDEKLEDRAREPNRSCDDVENHETPRARETSCGPMLDGLAVSAAASSAVVVAAKSWVSGEQLCETPGRRQGCPTSELLDQLMHTIPTVISSRLPDGTVFRDPTAIQFVLGCCAYGTAMGILCWNHRRDRYLDRFMLGGAVLVTAYGAAKSWELEDVILGILPLTAVVSVALSTMCHRTIRIGRSRESMGRVMMN